jgi:hypothetical protein
MPLTKGLPVSEMEVPELHGGSLRKLCKENKTRAEHPEMDMAISSKESLIMFAKSRAGIGSNFETRLSSNASLPITPLHTAAPSAYPIAIAT